VDVKTLSDGDLIKFLALKDFEKKKERWERYQAKSKMLDAPKDHKFWNTQPVPSLNEEISADQNCPIDAETDVSKVRQVCSMNALDTNTDFANIYMIILVDILGTL
jgi:uncharacterized protein (UPF0147 family)